MMKLCPACDRAAHDPAFRNPTHLTHREHGAAMVFDIYGEAVCPTCGARWRRERNDAVLLPSRRKSLERETPAPVTERRSRKRVTSGKPGRTALQGENVKAEVKTIVAKFLDQFDTLSTRAPAINSAAFKRKLEYMASITHPSQPAQKEACEYAVSLIP